MDAALLGWLMALTVVGIMALVVAVMALDLARAAQRRSAEAATVAANKAFAEKPTREERIATARAYIAACQGAELALADHRGELPAAMQLAAHRTAAAHAREQLRLLGIEA